MLLPILMLAVLDSVFAATCPGGFAPAHTAVRRMGSAVWPVSWHDVDWQCTVQFPGYEMLKRDFTKLSRAERELCGDDPVPLGLQKNRGTAGPYWRGAYDLPNGDTVSSEYLQHKKPTRTPEDVGIEWRGAVDLRSAEWWLVPTNTTFRCALCHRARRAQLQSFDARRVRPKPFTMAYTAVIDNVFFGQMTVQFFADFMQEIFDKANASIVVVRNSTFSLDGARKYSLRLKSAERLESDDLQSLLQGFEVSSWKDMDFCPAFTSPLLNSTVAKIGTVASGQLPGGFRWISRDCVAKVRGEGGDYDAVWGPTLLWVRINKECPTAQLGNRSVRFLNRGKRLDAVKSNLTQQLQEMSYG